MTEQQESRWSLNSTGNRVLLAVLIGLVVGVLAGAAGVHGGARVVLFVGVTGIAYWLATALRR